MDRREFIMAGGAVAGAAAVECSAASAKSARVTVTGLRADHLDRPLGLDNPRPTLSWRLESSSRNVRQSGYRIRVASTQESLALGNGDLWDSGKVESASSLGVIYQGRALISRQRCWWCVQIWDDAGAASEASIASWWEMGLLDSNAWTAQWLAAEDFLSRADRETEIHWIWGDTPSGANKRKFRFRFELPAPSTYGELFAATSGFWISAGQITGVWLDGAACSSEWPGLPSLIPGVGFEGDNLSGRPVALRAMSAGKHVISVEADMSTLPASVPPAFALFARFCLSNGDLLRIGSGRNWKTALADDANWYTDTFDDDSWEHAKVETSQGAPWAPRPAIQLRREFFVEKPVIKARLYATALGAYEARINGRRVGDAVLAPEQAQYAKRTLYRVHEVEGMLQPGRNAIGLTVGDGWYASFDGRFAWGPPPRRVIAQLELTFADGGREVVATGPDWRLTESPIRASEMRIGEIYDARFEQPGWDTVQFDDSLWRAAEIAERPPCRLAALTAPPIRATQLLTACTIREARPGVHIFDFGQHFTGWCRLRVRGARGTRIELTFAESLTLAGDVENSFYATGELKRDIYILKGHPSGETFEPRFTYRGIRYVRLTGLAAAPESRSLQGVVVHSDLEMTGQLTTDCALIERIWRNTLWTQRSNFVGIPIDCPSREQRGFMGDAGTFWDAAAFNMDVWAFTARHMDNVVDDQSALGVFPMATPEPPNNTLSRPDASVPAWADGAVILPWTVWRRYGSVDIIERNWDAMSRYLQFMERSNTDYICRSDGPGDWFALDQMSIEIAFDPNASVATPKDLIATAYWAHSVDLLAQMAEATGRTSDLARLQLQFQRISEAFNAAFVSSDGTVGKDSQTGYILALKFGLLSDASRRLASKRLIDDIRRRGNSLTTGILGTQFSLDVLADSGYTDTAYSLLLRTDYPSWGYMIKSGATTIWENWSGKISHYGQTHPVSQNHYSLGSICGFLFRRLAGIDAAAPGFERIVVRPALDQRVKRGGGRYRSAMGLISTSWFQASNGQLILEVSIPANATAQIHIPASQDSPIQEGGKDVSRRKDMRVIERTDAEAVIAVGSGNYRFVVHGNPRTNSWRAMTQAAT